MARYQQQRKFKDVNVGEVFCFAGYREYDRWIKTGTRKYTDADPNSPNFGNRPLLYTVGSVNADVLPMEVSK